MQIVVCLWVFHHQLSGLPGQTILNWLQEATTSKVLRLSRQQATRTPCWRALLLMTSAWEWGGTLRPPWQLLQLLRFRSSRGLTWISCLRFRQTCILTSTICTLHTCWPSQLASPPLAAALKRGSRWQAVVEARQQVGASFRRLPRGFTETQRK